MRTIIYIFYSNISTYSIFLDITYLIFLALVFVALANLTLLGLLSWFAFTKQNSYLNLVSVINSVVADLFMRKDQTRSLFQELRNFFRNGYPDEIIFFTKLLLSGLYFVHLSLKFIDFFKKVCISGIKQFFSFWKLLFYVTYQSLTITGYLNNLNIILSRQLMIGYYHHIKYSYVVRKTYVLCAINYYRDLIKMWKIVVRWYFLPHMVGTFLFIRYQHSLVTKVHNVFWTKFYLFSFFLRSCFNFLLSASWIRLQDATIPEFVEISYPLTTWSKWTYSTIKLMYQNDGQFFWTLQEQVDKYVISYLDNYQDLPQYLSKSNPNRGANTVAFLKEVRLRFDKKAEIFSEVELSHQVESAVLQFHELYKDRLALTMLSELRNDPYLMVRLNYEFANIETNEVAQDFCLHYLFDFLPILDKLFYFWQMQVMQEKQVHIAAVPTIIPEFVPNSAFIRPINAVYEGTKQPLRFTLESLFSVESIVLFSELVLEPFILGTLFIFDNGLGRTQYFGSYGSEHMDRSWYVFGVWENYLIIGMFLSCIIFPIYCRFFVYPIACELELGEDDVSQEWYFRFRLACVELFDYDPDEWDDLLFIVCVVFTVPYVLYRFPHYIRTIKYENDVDEVEGTFNLPWKEIKHYDKILQEVEAHARSTYLKDIYSTLKLNDGEMLAKESFFKYLVGYAQKTALFYKMQALFLSNPMTLMGDITGQFFSHYRNYLVLSIPHRRTPLKSRKGSQYLRTFLEHPAPVLTMYDSHLNTDFYTLAEHLRLCGGYDKMHKKKGPDRRIFPSVKNMRHIGMLDVFEDANVLMKVMKWQRMDKYLSVKRALFEANIHCDADEEDNAIDDGIHDYLKSDYLLDDEDEDDELRVITALNRFTGTPGDIMEFIVEQTTDTKKSLLIW